MSEQMPSGSQPAEDVTTRPAWQEGRRVRIGEDYPDAYAAKRMVVDAYLADSESFEAFRELFILELQKPIPTFEDHVFTLVEADARFTGGEKPSRTDFHLRRPGDSQRAAAIDAVVTRCEELRARLVAACHDGGLESASTKELAKEFQGALTQLDDVVRSTDTPVTLEKLKPLTPLYAAELLLWSYNFSQGNEDLQENIIKYLRLLRPDHSMSDEFFAEWQEQATSMVRGYMTAAIRHGLHAATSGKDRVPLDMAPAIDSTLDRGLHLFAREFSFPPARQNKQELIAQIAQYIIGMEYEYLIAQGGRQRTPAVAGKQSWLRDPYLSHLYYFGYLRHDAILPEFTEMFREVTGYVTTHRDALDTQKLSAIEEKYRSTHPNEIISD